ncbi:MAG: hypothetical protein JO232_20375 [Verrucomicrobia bacterium]|nr:hypothetical protein [Verrucomicrobiota bacterium]
MNWIQVKDITGSIQSILSSIALMSLVAELYRERPKRGDLLPWNRSFLRERLIDAR